MPGFTPQRGYPYPLPADPFHPAGSPDDPGDIQLLAEAINDDIQGLDDLLQPRKLVKLRGGVNQVVPTASERNITYDTELADTDGMADLTISSSAVNIQTAGLYIVHCLVTVPNGTWTNVILRVRQNGTEIASSTLHQQAVSPSRSNSAFGAMAVCVVGDQITTTISQNATGSIVLPSSRDLMVWRMAS
jgi:hypothetical protein